jgi:hypothetical protein
MIQDEWAAVRRALRLPTYQKMELTEYMDSYDMSQSIGQSS